MQVVSESVCVFVFRRRGARVEYLLLHRTPGRGGFWQSVSGRMEAGERAGAAAQREVREETALDPVRLITLEKVNVFYNAALEAIHLEPCFGAEVTSGAEPKLSAEHEAYRWSDAEEAERLLPFAGVREAFRELCAALGAEGGETG